MERSEPHLKVMGGLVWHWASVQSVGRIEITRIHTTPLWRLAERRNISLPLPHWTQSKPLVTATVFPLRSQGELTDLLNDCISVVVLIEKQPIGRLEAEISPRGRKHTWSEHPFVLIYWSSIIPIRQYHKPRLRTGSSEWLRRIKRVQ
jgi:hypothetical protein